MLSGESFFERIKSQMDGQNIAPDQNDANRIIAELQAAYPHATIKYRSDGISPSVSASSNNYTCMKCGTPLVNVSELKWDKHAQSWIPRKSPPKYHSAMCPTCDPTKGGVILGRVYPVKVVITET